MRIRVMTYNIHKGIGGVDRRYRPQRVVDAIVNCNPDIVLLQEVDDGVPRSKGHRQVDLLGDELQMPHRAFQRNVALTHGHYGNAVLSRFPIQDVRHLDLTIPLKKRRRALVVDCRLRHDGHTRKLIVANFHLGLAGFERRIQLRRFLDSSVLHRIHRDTAAIAAGDFNDVWGTLGKKLLEPVGFHCASGRFKTFPAFLPMRPLDRIYYRGSLELDHSFASRTKVAREASDHLPMVADFIVQ
jgi:endonuclease/exonuclease/phosphatase family metal-dependent hydrolase